MAVSRFVGMGFCVLEICEFADWGGAAYSRESIGHGVQDSRLTSLGDS